MRKLIYLFLIITALITVFYHKKANDIKLYTIDIDSCCIYSIDNFEDNEQILHRVFEIVYNSPYTKCLFVSKISKTNYSNGLVYTNGTSDLFYFQKKNSTMDEFTFASIYLVNKMKYDIELKYLCDSCAIYKSAFNGLNFNTLQSCLERTIKDQFEKKHNNFSYIFYNRQEECIKISFFNGGKNFKIRM